MSDINLRRGDILPTVGVLQLLLNRTGTRLTLDGNFGPRTEAAVQAFQRPRGLGGNGRVDLTTWRRLCANDTLPIVDSVDVTDPSLMRTEVADLVGAGGTPIHRGGMCNGVGQAVQDIVSSSPGRLFLLRMHGHGSPGVIGVSDGHGIEGNHRTAIDISTLRDVEPDLRRLNPLFGPYASVQLLGCNTGQGASGRRLLQRLADIWSVPVTAAVQTQYAGGTRTVRFEGPTLTCCPAGSSLATWVRSRPAFQHCTPV